MTDPVDTSTEAVRALVKWANELAEGIEYETVDGGEDPKTGEPLGPEPHGPTKESDALRRAADTLEALLAERDDAWEDIRVVEKERHRELERAEKAEARVEELRARPCCGVILHTDDLEEE